MQPRPLRQRHDRNQHTDLPVVIFGQSNDDQRPAPSPLRYAPAGRQYGRGGSRLTPVEQADGGRWLNDAPEFGELGIASNAGQRSAVRVNQHVASSDSGTPTCGNPGHVSSAIGDLRERQIARRMATYPSAAATDLAVAASSSITIYQLKFRDADSSDCQLIVNDGGSLKIRGRLRIRELINRGSRLKVSSV
jgi:hypothetical protein